MTQPFAPPAIVCRGCGEPILERSELLVVGRVLSPVHAACSGAFAATQPWYVRSWALNRWRGLLALNAGLLAVIAVGAALRPELPLGGLILILAFANGWLLIGRAISWFTIERHVPER